MFTGIVDAVGRIDAVRVNNGVELRVKASYKGVKKGESIAVNGACLTVESSRNLSSWACSSRWAISPCSADSTPPP